MSEARSHLAESFERILRQRRAVTALHLCALPIVNMCYWFGHMVAIPANANRRTGVFIVTVTVLGWLPLLISWVLVRNPNEGTWSFRLWQLLFVLINVAACIVFVGQAPFRIPGGTLGASVWFAVLLGAISPMARGPTAADAGR